MKQKFIKSAFLVLAIGAMTISQSCKKFLDYESDSTSSEAVVFESTTSTNTAVIGVYNKLIGDNGYGSRISTLFGITADDFKTSGSYISSDRRGISMYGASSDNSDLINPFAQLYAGIERANLCIKYIPESKLYTSGSATDKDLMKRYYGEALALRALFYLELIRNWGDVPSRFVPAAFAEDLFPKNTNRDETYDQLIIDLKLAQDLVGWRSEIVDYGSFRFTKGAIKGLRARIALYRGGYSLRSENHTMERRSDYLKYYQIALDECKDIMNNRSQHTLNPVYENVFKTLHTANRLDDAHELMFEVAAFGANASTDSKLGYYNGVRFAAASTYGTGGGGMNAIPTYFYEFDQTRDCRRDVTIGTWEITGNSKKLINVLNNFTDAKFRKSWTAFNNSSSSQNFAVNWPILRFADVLLMFAEAENEINGPTTLAVNALQEVQKRAYAGFEGQIPTAPTSKAAFFDAIVKERLLEFGGEGVRKYDLIRWNLINSKFIETRAKLVQLIDGTGPYINVPNYVYAKEATYNNSASGAEVQSLDLYGGTANVVLFSPGLNTATAPTGYTTKNWRKQLSLDNSVTGLSTGFATYFEANKKELFPYPKTALNENPNMVQNYGY